MREVTPEDCQRLRSISKRAKYQSKRQRAVVVLCSANLMSAPAIACWVGSDESHLRKVIHAFNDGGGGSLALTTGVVPEGDVAP